ncbi:MAG: hypothetical protein PHF84_10160 [bacterium]|nr:hypothetical protein [bacterium]
MKKRIKIIFILLILIYSTGTRVSASSYAFLEFGAASRMAGSRTGAADSSTAEAAVYNPSLLISGKNEVMLNYYQPFGRNLFDEASDGIEGINVYDIGFSLSRERSGFGMNVLLLQNSGFKGYDENGSFSGSFDTLETAVTIGYGRKLKYFNLGVNTRMVYQRLYSGYERMMLALGTGISRNVLRNLRAGLMLDNLLADKLYSRNMTYEKLIPRITGALDYQIGRLTVGMGMGTDLEQFLFSLRATVNIVRNFSLLSEYGNSTVEYTDGTTRANELRNMLNGGMELKWQRFTGHYLLTYRGDLGMDQSLGIKFNY